jgi:hypothetical protein
VCNFELIVCHLCMYRELNICDISNPGAVFITNCLCATFFL